MIGGCRLLVFPDALRRRRPRRQGGDRILDSSNDFAVGIRAVSPRAAVANVVQPPVVLGVTIVGFVAAEQVVSCTALELVVESAALDNVVALSTMGDVVTALELTVVDAREEVVAAITEDAISALGPSDPVVSRPSVDRVGVEPAVDAVVPGAAVNGVLSEAASADEVASVVPVDLGPVWLLVVRLNPVRPVAAVDRVRASPVRTVSFPPRPKIRSSAGSAKSSKPVVMASSPGPASIRSPPPFPLIWSLPARPKMQSRPGVPFSTSLPFVPTMLALHPLGGGAARPGMVATLTPVNTATSTRIVLGRIRRSTQLKRVICPTELAPFLVTTRTLSYSAVRKSSDLTI